jgi:hypothetical protein
MTERRDFEGSGRDLPRSYLKGLAAIVVVALLLVGDAKLGLLRPIRASVLFICVWIVFRAYQLRNLERDAGGARKVWETRRRREQGVWADPPVAELDKSTLGLLLADRLRRDPALHVVVARREARPTPPASNHDLWDRELDG